MIEEKASGQPNSILSAHVTAKELLGLSTAGPRRPAEVPACRRRATRSPASRAAPPAVAFEAGVRLEALICSLHMGWHD